MATERLKLIQYKTAIAPQPKGWKADSCRHVLGHVIGTCICSKNFSQKGQSFIVNLTYGVLCENTLFHANQCGTLVALGTL